MKTREIHLIAEGVTRRVIHHVEDQAAMLAVEERETTRVPVTQAPSSHVAIAPLNSEIALEATSWFSLTQTLAIILSSFSTTIKDVDNLNAGTSDTFRVDAHYLLRRSRSLRNQGLKFEHRNRY